MNIITEEWNKDDLCLDDQEKSKEILLKKLLDLKKQKKTVIIRNLDNIDRKFIHILAQKEDIYSRAINRKKNKNKITGIADLEISSEREIQPLLPRVNWKGECSVCSTNLTLDEAVFNWRLPYPFCEECVKNNEELSCYKWEKSIYL